MGKKEDNKKKKQDALLDTAFNLFTTKGLHNTSIDDIVREAGIAKGTFYLYFKNKYDLQNKLVSAKAGQVFMKAYRQMQKQHLESFEDQLLYLVDHILNQLSRNKILLAFISKNLSWGVFLESLEKDSETGDSEFLKVYRHIVSLSQKKYRHPEILLYMIIELVNSTCYSVILFGTPVTLEELKPYLHQTIRDMMKAQEIA